MLPDPLTPPDSPEPELDPGNPAPDAPLPGAPEEIHDLATPEGDNERPTNAPLTGGVPTPVRPRGDQPHTDEPLYPTAY